MPLEIRMRSTCLIAIAMVAASGHAAPPAATAPNVSTADTTIQSVAESTLVLPGGLTPDLGIDDLRRRFGAANVSVMQIDGAEGEQFEGIVLFDADPQRRAEIFPRDAATLHGIESIRVSGTASRWQLDNGVRLGTTLDELVALNGKPISFSGMDWDYGGSVLEWHGGRLAPREGDAVFRGITLAHRDDAPDGSIPLGDGEFRSDDPAYPRQGGTLYVGRIVVSFIAPDAP
jgi:hypothetical protein